MFYKALPNGKYRYYEKYFNELEGGWKQVSITLDSKSRQAQAQAKRLLSDKIDDAHQVNQKTTTNVTVYQALKEWGSIRQTELKESTYNMQNSILSNFEKEFGQYQLRAVNSVYLQRYLLSKEWSKDYIAINKTIFSLFFNYCCQMGYLAENPVKSVILPRRKKTIEELRKQKEKFLSKEEMSAYLSYLREHGKNRVTNLLIEFLYLTGLRSGEAFALQWQDIDFQSKTIQVVHTLYSRGRVSDYSLTSPKTLSGYRTISINARVLAILNELRTTSKSDFIFVGKEGYPYTLGALNPYLRRTFLRSGINKGHEFRLTSHVLRHSHISLLVELDVPLKLIMDRVGHSDEKTTLNIYTHVTQTMHQSLSDKMEMIKI